MTLGTEPIVDDFHPRLRAFVSRRVRNPTDVNDIVQETFLRVHRHLGAVRRTDRLAAWVFQIARNAIVDHYRRRGDDPGLPEPLPTRQAPENPILDMHGGLEIAACLAPMIAVLPPPDRQAVQMTDIDGLTQHVTARRAGVTLSGMKSRVQRARRKLKGMLLECCRIELDRRGGIVDYEPRKAGCDACRSAAPTFAKDIRTR